MHRFCYSAIYNWGGRSRGGGGYFHMYAYWVCTARETPIFSPEFTFRSISFSQITKKSVPEHHHFTFFGGFCRSRDHHFQNFFNFNPFIASHGRLSPNANVRQRRGLAAIPEIRIFTLKTDQACLVSNLYVTYFDYRIPQPDSGNFRSKSSHGEPVHVLTTSFSSSVSPVRLLSFNHSGVFRLK